MRQTLQRMACIVALGVALGLAGNAVSPLPRRIPLLRPPKTPLASRDQVSLSRARALWESGTAIFLDARSSRDYSNGHITGALNLPAMEFDKTFPQVRRKLDAEMPMVLYCDGAHCELSQQLMLKLHGAGLTNAVVFVNGWTLWRGVGLPTRKGDEP